MPEVTHLLNAATAGDKKAAAELDIPSKHMAKFEKAMTLDIAGMEKALDPMAKDVKRKNGKEMVAELRKAGYL